MILFFSSTMVGGIDPQTSLLIDRLEKRGRGYCLLNPHKMIESGLKILQRGGRIELSLNGRTVSPSVVFLSTRWRTDSIISIPQGCQYPSVFRLRVEQFLQDLRFTLEDKLWLPGKIEDIERAESKPYLFALSHSFGLETPSYTLDSFGSHLDQGLPAYRKNLGSPFTISLNKEKGVEVGITVTNCLVGTGAEVSSDESPWQWQEPIEAAAQIRSFVFGDKVWSVAWKYPRNQKFLDLRFFNQIKKKPILWSLVNLPNEVTHKLTSLVREMGLSFASPEFLVEKKTKRLILIDLNPCGDWHGFFPKEIQLEISEKICGLLTSKIK